MIVISPVMARSLRTGTFFSADTIPVTMVIPADGPSFGTPIIVASTATSWFSCQSVGRLRDLAFALMNWAAAATLSFITRCMEPRLTIRPVPFKAWTSKLRMQPRSSPMTARPMTSPTVGLLGRVTCLLPVGVGQGGRDRLTGLGEPRRKDDGAILAGSHQVKLIADPLAALDGQRQ